jgi:hypothetical protein
LSYSKFVHSKYCLIQNISQRLIACVSQRWLSERRLGIRYSGGSGASVSSESESRRSELLVFLSGDADDGFGVGGSREVGFLNFAGDGFVGTLGLGGFSKLPV